MQRGARAGVRWASDLCTSAMWTRGLLSGLLLGLSIWALGCGGGDKPAESADSKTEEAKAEPEAEAKAEAKPEDGDEAEAKPEDKAADKKPAAPADDGPKPSRT